MIVTKPLARVLLLFNTRKLMQGKNAINIRNVRKLSVCVQPIINMEKFMVNRRQWIDEIIMHYLLIIQTSKYWSSQVALVVKKLPANAGDIRDGGSILELGRSPRGGHGNPLQYCCLENPLDRRAWWATSKGSLRVGHDWSDQDGPRDYHTKVSQTEKDKYDMIYMWNLKNDSNKLIY